MSRLANRTARLRRLEELLYLKPDGMPVTALAERMDVHRRTVYRDLDFLCEQGVPIWQENGRYGLNRARYVTTVHLSFHESIALVLAGLLLSRTVDEHNPHVAAALHKLATTLPRPLTPHLKRAAERVLSRNSAQHVAVLEAIAEGWGNGRKVQIGYRSPRSGTLHQRVLSPYALEPTPTGIYVIGYDDWAEDIRTFKLDRLENATVLDEQCAPMGDFDLEEYLGSGWRIMAGDDVQDVVLRFTPDVAAHVAERNWHPSQELETLDDGGCLLRVSIAEPLEMQPWIRSWGAQVEVLEPIWLRQQVAEELRRAAERYQ